MTFEFRGKYQMILEYYLWRMSFLIFFHERRTLYWTYIRRPGSSLLSFTVKGKEECWWHLCGQLRLAYTKGATDPVPSRIENTISNLVPNNKSLKNCEGQVFYSRWVVHSSFDKLTVRRDCFHFKILIFSVISWPLMKTQYSFSK